MTPADRADARVLVVEADLSARVGDISTHVEALGSKIHWTFTDPGAFDLLPPVTRREIVRLARGLRRYGLSLEIADDKGSLLELGDIRRSPVGRLLIGTGWIRPRRLRFWARRLL